MKMSARVDDLCQAYQTRQLTRREFGKRLAALAFIDPERRASLIATYQEAEAHQR